MAESGKRWVCLVCGYVHHGDEPPEICPECGAPRECFELDEDPVAPESSNGGNASSRGNPSRDI